MLFRTHMTAIFLKKRIYEVFMLPIFTLLASLQYPPVSESVDVDNYHGILVKDPYRCLEDSTSKETQDWIQKQNALTFSHLEALPERKQILSRLRVLWDFEKQSTPIRKGKRFFFLKNSGLQNQAVLCTSTDLNGHSTPLVNPNALNSDGTTAIAFFEPSEDGKLIAYGLTEAGSDWTIIRVCNPNGNLLDDRLEWVKFSTVTWDPSGKGFYYCRYDAPKTDIYESVNSHQKVYFHVMGTLQEKDRLVFEQADQPDWIYKPILSYNGNILFIEIYLGASRKTAIFYQNLKEGSFKPLKDSFDAEYQYIESDGKVVWLATNLDAPNGRVIQIDLTSKESKEIIPEASNAMQDVSSVGSRFIVHYLKDASSEVVIYKQDGSKEKVLDFPDIGTASFFTGGFYDSEVFYTFSSFTRPPAIFSYNFTSGKTEILFEPSYKADLGAYETRQIFYPSLDGTKIPLFLCYKKGTAFNAKNIVYLYGYGGFGVPITPAFSPKILSWIEMGGVYAIANLRGGGEYGESWHAQGKKEKKQNVFDDFFAAMQWLVKENITVPSKIAIGGRSNGGLLIGACLTQRPELFGAAAPAVGVMDMLRYQQFTIGRAWVPEYGSSENPEDFTNLLRYSPLHNTKKTNYPPTLVITGDHDDRVVPLHSYKFAAALQKAQSGPAPILIRIDTSSGHGIGTSTSKALEECADTWAFLRYHLMTGEIQK